MKTFYYIIGSLVIVATIVFLVIISRGKRGNSINIPHDDFFNDLFEWKYAKEGGLATSSVDSELEKSPWIYNINGRVIEHPHTSHGVIYSNFKKYAPKYGYPVDKETFQNMPLPLWKSIMYNEYMSKGYNFTTNPVLAAYMGLWYWGGWDTALVPKSEVQNIFRADIPNVDKLRRLVDKRKEYFREVVARNPNKEGALHGWENLAEEFYTKYNGLLT